MSTAKPEAADTCGACEREDALDEHVNAAGLDAIEYRVGEYGRFLSRMSGWISRQSADPNDPEDPERPLAKLTTRADDDPTLALMDAWACTLDVLTFYQERIANEGFLRTATERRSVLELARAIGYELDPGVAASTRLAFTLLDTDKAPDEVSLAAGLQVQSVPGPGELPQTFETVEEIVARPEWNAMVPAQREEYDVDFSQGDTLYLSGVSTGLSEGDRLLRIEAGGPSNEDGTLPWSVLTVRGVEVDKQAGVTAVTIDSAIQVGPQGVEAQSPGIFAFSVRAKMFGYSAPDPRTITIVVDDNPENIITMQGDEWKGFDLPDTAPDESIKIDLDGEVEGLLAESWLLFEQPGEVHPYEVDSVTPSGRTDFGLSRKTTEVTLVDWTSIDSFDRRQVTVHAVSRELTVATRPIEGAVELDEIELDGVVTALEAGRAVFVIGPEHDSDDDTELVELATVAQTIEPDEGGPTRTVLQLESNSNKKFDRTRTRILGNVARATHGKTVSSEVLGSGDGSKTFQAFTLRQPPLTYVSSPTGGTESTLTLRVGGVRWEPVSSTYGLGPDDRVYVPRIDDEGGTTVGFGDGINGARLPTGTENITASYRAGLGSDGSVDAGTLTILKTRPQGVKAVTNPEAASGADDPEVFADAQQNAPVTVLTLDRLVSVRDYEDYARAYPGVGKAQAVRLWDGRRYWVHLTLATAEGEPVDTQSDLYLGLTADIDAHRDPVQRVMFGTFERRTFRLRGTVRVDEAYVAEDVIAAVTEALQSSFDFKVRSFGQAVSGAEILAIAHEVPGVVAVDLDALWFDDDDDAEPPAEASSPASWVLSASAARWDKNKNEVQPAELLLLAADEPDGPAIDLQEPSS